MKNKKTILIFAGILLLFSGIVNAQQQVAIIGTNVGKEIKLSINAGFHLSNMIGKGVQKEDNIFISAYSTNDSPYWYECYGLYAGGYNGLLPGYKFGLGMTFDMNTFFAWGFDLNFETKGCRIPIKEIITSYYTTITDPFFTSTLEEKKSIAVSNLYSKIRLNYIVIPIRTEFKYKKFYCMPGIYARFLLNAINTTKFDYEDQKFDIRHTPTSHYAWIDFGIFLNTGFCFSFSSRHSIKIGIVGEWNVSGIQRRRIPGGSYNFFSSQVFGLELKYEIKVK